MSTHAAHVANGAWLDGQVSPTEETGAVDLDMRVRFVDGLPPPPPFQSHQVNFQFPWATLNCLNGLSPLLPTTAPAPSCLTQFVSGVTSGLDTPALHSAGGNYSWLGGIYLFYIIFCGRRGGGDRGLARGWLLPRRVPPLRGLRQGLPPNPKTWGVGSECAPYTLNLGGWGLNAP